MNGSLFEGLNALSFLNVKQAVDSELFTASEKLNFVTKAMPLNDSFIEQTLCIQFCNSQQNFWVFKPDRTDIFETYDEALADMLFFIGRFNDE